LINTIISSEYFYLIFFMMLTAIPVGFFAGLFGIGGGLISVPFLFFLFDSLNFEKDYIMHLSVGTSFSITILTSLSSVLTHRKNNAFDFNIVFNYGIFVIIGVLIGTFLTTFLKTKSLVLFFSIIVYFFGAYLMLKNETKQIKTDITFFKKLFFGSISGMICAPMGITGAMMNVPILRFFGYPINVAIGCSSGIGFMISLFGAIGFFISGFYLDVDLPLSLGFVNIPAFLIFIPITTLMARVGANTVHRMDKVKVQRLFGVFLYVIGTIFLLRFLNI
tara:strand:+ start:1485 stop:2315 length:831 start_codon:yes stop_codon:yes gene_type:complete